MPEILHSYVAVKVQQPSREAMQPNCIHASHSHTHSGDNPPGCHGVCVRVR